ncbi:MAG TPA: DUF3237 domain-containing protein [Sphingomonadaceae bacterium]|jgi:hypothetical protein|nr:DUF3237 domain-containing protein [Sphingomonadaceae bacterium]
MRAPALDFAFRIRLEFGSGPRLRFDPAYAGFTRGFVSVLGGTIEGPRLNGRVVSQSGGDWPKLWKSGLVEFEAHYILEADDGTPLYIHNRGIAYAGPEALAALERGEQPAETPYCRITPRFEAPPGPHEWMTRTVFVGTGERRGDHSVFDYYSVA